MTSREGGSCRCRQLTGEVKAERERDRYYLLLPAVRPLLAWRLRHASFDSRTGFAWRCGEDWSGIASVVEGPLDTRHEREREGGGGEDVEVVHRTLWCVHYASALYVSQINTRLFMLDNSFFLPAKHVSTYITKAALSIQKFVSVWQMYLRARNVW